MLTDQQRAVLGSRLADAEIALHKLAIGQATTSITYEGQERRLKPADAGFLRGYIADLRGQLGLGGRFGGLRP